MLNDAESGLRNSLPIVFSLFYLLTAIQKIKIGIKIAAFQDLLYFLWEGLNVGTIEMYNTGTAPINVLNAQHLDCNSLHIPKISLRNAGDLPVIGLR